MKFKDRQIIFIIFISFVLILSLFIIKIPFTVKSPCRFVAQCEWSLVQLAPDKLMSRFVQNDSNRLDNFSLLQFDRQDFVRFSLEKYLYTGLSVRKEDIIGRLSSSENQFLLADLEGQLAKSKAELNLLLTGEKLPLQQEAREALKYAEAELAAYLPQIERTRQLFNQNLTSKEELEKAEATLNLYKVNVSLQKAKLGVVQSGEKNEAIHAMEMEVLRLENQLKVVQNKVASEQIKSPLTGIVTDPTDPNVIVQISKMDTMVAYIPIPEGSRKHIQAGQKIRFYSSMNNEITGGIIKSIGNQARDIAGKPMFIAISLIHNAEHNFLPGTTGFAKINVGKTSLIQQISRAWTGYSGKSY